MPGLILIGAGPGIGQSVARRFASEGLPVGVLARSDATVGAALAALEHAGVETHGERADAADEDSLRAGLDALTGRLGIPEALVYNAALTQGDSIGRAPASSGSRPPRRKPRWGRAPKGSRSSTRR